MKTQMQALSAGVIEAALLLCVAVVPVFVNFYSFRVFEQDKFAIVFSLATLAALAGVVALVEGRFQGLQAGLRQPLVVAALLLAVATLAATAVSIAPRLSLFGSHERAQGLMALIAGLVLFATGAWVAQDGDRRRRLVAGLLIGSVPVAILAVTQALGLEIVAGEVESAGRVFGTLSNPIFLGAYLMLVVPFGVARAGAAVRRRRWLMVALLAVLVVLQVGALVLSASRGPMLGLAAGLAVMTLAWAVATNRRSIGLALLILGALLLLTLFVFNLPASPLAPLREVPVLGRFGQIAQTATGSEATRVRIWSATNRLLAGEPQRLVVGHGPETLKYALLSYSEANMPGRAQADRLVDRAHNVLLDSLTMTGLIGAASLLLVYVSWLLTAVAGLGLIASNRDTRALAILLVGGAVLLGVLGAALAPTYWAALTMIGLVGGLVVFLVIGLVAHRADDEDAEPIDPAMVALLGVGAAVVVEGAFGIQTVVTQMVFWVLAGVLVASAIKRRHEVAEPAGRAGRRAQVAGAGRGARSARSGEAGGECSGNGVVVLGWAPGGAAIGLATGAAMSSLVYSFVLHGTEPLPAALPVVLVVALLTWLAGVLIASECGEGAFAAAITAPAVVALYIGLRWAILAVTGDAAQLFGATVFWLLLLAVLAGLWLRTPTRRLPFWIGPVGVLYPVLAVLLLTFSFLRAVKPVQADIYFQSAMASYSVAVATDDRDLFRTADELYARAVSLNGSEPLYPMKWGEKYTQLGTAVLASTSADYTAAAAAFGRAQELLIAAEELEPLMPYHAFNRGHLQLLFAQALPADQAEQRSQVAANAAVAFDEAFSVLQHDPQVANEYAMARLLEGRMQEAVALLEYSLELDAESPETYAMLGQAYAAAGRLDDARRVLEKAQTLGVGGAQILGTLGELARQQGELAEALNYYKQAAAEEPENWMILYNLGLLYDEMGDRSSAVDMLMRALPVAPPSEAQRVQDAIDTVMGTGAVLP